jgi:hypothetical protein
LPIIFITAAGYELIQPGNASCACLGDVLTYTCTAVGGGNTQWGGTAFDCPDTSNEIVLSHTFYASEGTRGVCNNGAATGRSLGVIDRNCYTSQLNITVQKTTSTVQCIHNTDSGPIEIGESSIAAISGRLNYSAHSDLNRILRYKIYHTDPYPPPSNLKITDIQSGIITFIWDPVAPNCSSVQYTITSDCGICPMITNSANVTCSDQEIPSMCVFRVQSMICGFIGSSSAPIEQELKCMQPC